MVSSMNSVKLWDTKSAYKNQLPFYAPTMNSPKKIKKRTKFSVASKRRKDFAKEMKALYTENYKTLRRHLVLRFWEPSYCYNVYRTRSNPLLQCNSYQNHDGNCQKQKKNANVHMPPQMTLDSKNSIEEEKQCWMEHVSDFK